MAIFTEAISVTGTQTIAATAATITASKVADLDYKNYNWTMTLTVDGGSPQTLTLTSKFSEVGALINALQAQTTGATWSADQSGVVSVASNGSPANTTSLVTATTAAGADLYIADNTYSNGAVATKAEIDGSGSADFDFSAPANKYTAMVSVDGGFYQTIVLTTNTSNITGLKAALNAQITGATFTNSSNTLILKSNSTGRQSSLVWRIVSKGAKDIKLPQTDPAVHGANAIGANATGSQAADLDYRDKNYSASFALDGGSAVPFTLTTTYANAAALVTSLNTKTSTSAFTQTNGVIKATSSTTGTSSEATFTLVTPSFSDLGFVNADVFGVNAITTHKATPIFTTSTGSAVLPNQVQIFNNGAETDPVLYVVNPTDTVIDNGFPIRPGSAETIPVEAGETVYCLAPAGATVDARVLITRK